MLASAHVSDRERALLARARDGDVEAFAELVRLLERRVRALLGRLLDDEREVEEAAQDTFVQAWRSLDRFRGEAAPFTWIYRIAVNEALQRTRRKRLDLTPLDDLPELAEAQSPRTGGLRSPDELLESREVASHLAARLRELPIEFRAPLVLRDVEGWSNQEVADALGLSLPAAKSRIHRARMRLRQELAPWLAAGGRDEG
jgi:RNA polymerase sigma-70 factor (ECF subfamily)